MKNLGRIEPDLKILMNKRSWFETGLQSYGAGSERTLKLMTLKTSEVDFLLYSEEVAREREKNVLVSESYTVR